MAYLFRPDRCVARVKLSAKEMMISQRAAVNPWVDVAL